jgi:hypothetical protein
MVEKLDKKALWIRLKEYHFDHIVPPSLWEKLLALYEGIDSATVAFADKIASKHKWNRSFALHAISEYKKFVYLAVVSDFQVTPSKIIDVVWHEHILFSKAYREFCDLVIEYQLDHHPELFAFDEQTDRFRYQHEKTRTLYHFEFGKEPPENIWGQTKYQNSLERSTTSDSTIASSDSTIASETTEHPLHSLFDGYERALFEGPDGNIIWDGHTSSGDSDGDSGGDSGGCSSGCGG